LFDCHFRSRGNLPGGAVDGSAAFDVVEFFACEGRGSILWGDADRGLTELLEQVMAGFREGWIQAPGDLAALLERGGIGGGKAEHPEEALNAAHVGVMGEKLCNNGSTRATGATQHRVDVALWGASTGAATAAAGQRGWLPVGHGATIIEEVRSSS
jgi:hypothetical protein